MFKLKKLSWKHWLVAFPMVAMASGTTARAQSAPQGMSVTGYSSTTAMVQDPPGSPWHSVASESLPDPAQVLSYQQDEWVEINEHGRRVRISIMNVQLTGEPSQPGIVDCPNGQQQPYVAGVQGSGGC